ncbi:isocitrate lyase/PEP mutase family protein [Ancylobacter oerskovii]|uniref:Oxaloacetate decarboxylase n=1 Tax=Ancylobacter oerskovii TaxID=459519 RepID=A0ABW4YZA2_9HYPH|nr:isocitrate lyase/phosphoenolpyruvate mutase family protein [Ancylobacter oerskovii]MBS7543826.1 isocitrate lyase/phosphoenolpyruvate mutase family protein [Ancylobacter oerskovii]
MSARATFRSLLEAPELLILPGVYDAFSARIAESVGFRGLSAGGNSTTGGLLAGPDLGQSNMRDIADAYGRICDAVQIPVTVDADTGFGSVHNTWQMVRAFERAGVAAIQINDQAFPNRCHYFPGRQIVPAAEMIGRIKAALDARRDTSLSLVARTDVGAENLDEAIERCQLYLEAGADYAKAQGIDSEAGLSRLVAEVPCPITATLSQAADNDLLDFADMERIGLAGVTLPTIAIYAAMQGQLAVMRALREGRSFRAIGATLPSAQAYYELVGLHREMERELEFEKSAAAVIDAARARRDP